MRYLLLLAIVLAGIIFLGFILYVNIWNRKRRSSMTPEERLKDDEEIRHEGRVW